jgi:uncharacterized protein YgbK (DUF1537 family)
MADTPIIAFYGDDFTGSTDALECLAAAGLRSILFIDVPSPDVLSRFPGLEAVGIAGNTRTLTPEEMEITVPRALEALVQTRAPILHYKVCSTFDSSPNVGSLGKVMDLARAAFGHGTIPIIVGAPRLGRYSLFGNLFARHNVDDTVHRLDRHPTMSVHPTTPMREADIRKHLAAQTTQQMTLVSAIDIVSAGDDVARLDSAFTSASAAVVIDLLDEDAEERVGRLLDRMAKARIPLFVLGSSGVEYALIAFWKARGQLPAVRPELAATAVDRLFVISGSCSPTTAAQIAVAVRAGFAEIALDPLALIQQEATERYTETVVDEIVALLEMGRSVVAHSATGADDPRETSVKAHFARQGLSDEGGRIQGGRALARAAGILLERVLRRVALDRFVVAGGDTSTAAVKALGIDALEMVASLAPGAPICRALAPGRDLHGQELVLKGGQIGSPEFFLQAKAGQV